MGRFVAHQTYPETNDFGAGGVVWACAKLPNVIPESVDPKDSNSVFCCGGDPNELCAGVANVEKPVFGLPKVAAPPKDAVWPKMGADAAALAPNPNPVLAAGEPKPV